jgi:protein NrfD
MQSVEQLIQRTNPGVDPHLDVWEWQIPIYLFLGGLVAGLMVIGAWQELRGKDDWSPRLSRVGALAALALLAVGLLALFLDLANPQYVYRFYLAFRPTSPMSWGAWWLLFTFPTVALWGITTVDLPTLRQWQARFPLARLAESLHRLAHNRQTAIRRAVLIMGLGLGVYTGILLQTLVARPLWNSGLLGPLFLASGVSAGAAFYMLARAGGRPLTALLRWDIAALSIEATLLVLLLLEKSGGGPADRAAAASLLGGPYTGAFFGLVVMAGILVPLTMEAMELRQPRRHAIFAPALILVGSFAMRAVLVMAGLATGVQLLG